MKELIHSDRHLLILGSLNANPQDRKVSRDEIEPVQTLDSQMRFRSIGFFSQWGECGLSSMALDPANPDSLFMATSTKIVHVDCAAPELTELAIDNLVDIHEISIVGGSLWIANTGRDEIIRYDLGHQTVEERISLRQFVDLKAPALSEGEEIVETLHCNQFFKDLAGERAVLVHHTEGRQILKRIAERLLKSQGNGGVLNIGTGQSVVLNLKAPHSLRICQDKYTILDSGHFLLQVFDRNWKAIKSVDTKGFGRGADYDIDRSVFYVGVSATRKRYLKLVPRGSVGNMVLFYSLPNFELVYQKNVPNIEQINDVYLISSDLAEKLVGLEKHLPVTEIS